MDKPVADLTSGAPAALDDLLYTVRSPYEVGDDRKLTLQEFFDTSGTLAGAGALAGANTFLLVQSGVATAAPLTDLVAYLAANLTLAQSSITDLVSDLAALSTGVSSKVAKAGDTMTGDLVLTGANIEVDGDISCTGQVNIREVDYIWPVSQGGAGTRLVNDGTGVLSWELQNISATQRVLGRNTAGAGDMEEVTASQLIDWIGSTRGSVLYRGASGWAILTPGTSGHVLTSGGAGADPSYAASTDTTKVAKAGDTMSGALVVQAAVTADQLILTQSSLTYAATTDIDFDLKPFRTLSLTGNVTFTTSHKAAGKTVSLKIACDSSARNLTFPAWVFVGAAAPTSIAANKTAILTVTCFGTADTDIVAAYAVQP